MKLNAPSRIRFIFDGELCDIVKINPDLCLSLYFSSTHTCTTLCISHSCTRYRNSVNLFSMILDFSREIPIVHFVLFDRAMNHLFLINIENSTMHTHTHTAILSVIFMIGSGTSFSTTQSIHIVWWSSTALFCCAYHNFRK